MYNIYEELEQEFVKRAYVWSVGGKPIVPTAKDIQDVVDNAVKNLYAEPDGSLIERGRLIVQKNGTHYDIYLHIGDTK